MSLRCDCVRNAKERPTSFPSHTPHTHSLHASQRSKAPCPTLHTPPHIKSQVHTRGRAHYMPKRGHAPVAVKVLHEQAWVLVRHAALLPELHDIWRDSVSPGVHDFCGKTILGRKPCKTRAAPHSTSPRTFSCGATFRNPDVPYTQQPWSAYLGIRTTLRSHIGKPPLVGM
jgi:hypothetical protein